MIELAGAVVTFIGTCQMLKGYDMDKMGEERTRVFAGGLMAMVGSLITVLG